MVFRISEIEEKREKVPAQYRANPANALTDTFDDKRIDAPTEQERRNAALRALSEADGAEREADRAGVLAGRAREGMYNNAAAEQAQKRAEKARKERAETAIYLAMLQQLDAEIAALDIEIDDILIKHLSPDEVAYLDDIEDPEERAREEMRIMREKLASGEITQAEFDKFEDRWNARAGYMADRAEVKAKLSAAQTAEERQEITMNEDIDDVRDARRHELDIEIEQEVVGALEVRYDAGNTAKTNDVSAFSAVMGGASVLGEGGALSNNGGMQSFAALTSSDQPFTASLPKLQEQFVAAAHEQAKASAVAQVDIDLAGGRTVINQPNSIV
tara:strand:- start:13641 stop:14633 length:993 start_codon:yes stop_codon:yes gene_type:complete